MGAVGVGYELGVDEIDAEDVCQEEDAGFCVGWAGEVDLSCEVPSILARLGFQARESTYCHC